MNKLLILITLLFLNSAQALSSTVYSTECPSNIVSEKTIFSSIPKARNLHAELVFERNIEDGTEPTYLWLAIVNNKTGQCYAFDIGDATSAKFIKTKTQYTVQVLYLNQVYRYDLSELARGRADRTILR